MREPVLRRWHRYLGILLAPLVLLQALSGLLLTVDFLFRYQRRVHGFLTERELPAIAELLDLLLYQVHFGGTRFGYYSNLAVGWGLVGLLATGVLIFVLVQARTLGRKRAAQPAARSPEPQVLPAAARLGWEFDVPKGSRTAMGTLLLAAAGLFLLSLLAFYRAYSLSSLHVPHAHAVADLQLDVIQAHGALEALIAAGGVGRVDAVWDHLEAARRTADHLLEGVRRDGPPVPPLAERPLRDQMKEIRSGLALLETLALQRYLDSPRAEAGEPLEGRYAQALAAVLEALRAIRGEMVTMTRGDQERLVTTSVLLLSAAFAATLTLAVVFSRYKAAEGRHLKLVHEARERAEENQEFFRQVIQQAADAFLVFAPDGAVLDANRAACAWLGYERDELLARSAPELIVDWSGQEMAAAWARMEPGAPVSVRALHRRRDGSTVPAVANLGLLRWRQRRAILYLARETGTAAGPG